MEPTHPVFYIIAVKATRAPLCLHTAKTKHEAICLADQHYDLLKKLQGHNLASSGISIRVYNYPAHLDCLMGEPELKAHPGLTPVWSAGAC